MKSRPGPPMTLGNAVAARVRLIAWCKEYGHRVQPEPAELVCSRCGSRNVDMVVTGTERR
jgi:Zn finger protein HypA/HybF involved in hydrogenase expression